MDGGTILGFLLSLFFGFIPMFLFAYLLYWIDRYEKEPKLLLIGTFIWGAVVAAGVAFIVNTVLGLGVYMFTGSDMATELTTGSIIAPVVEEFLKGFAVLLVFLIFRKEFDSILDGIVYAGIAALGFAATENTYYIFSYGYMENGIAGTFFLVFVRVILVGWQHPFYTAFFGIGLAISRLSRNGIVKFIAPVGGLGLSIFTHSMHNTLASFMGGLGGLAVGTLVDWSGWFIMVLFILWALYREQQWLITELREEVKLGILSPGQYRVACSAWRQSYTRLTALFSGRFQATRKFYKITAELAYKKHQRASLGEESGNTNIINKYRSELARLSASVEG
jgi:RsiW-degrading membrane proteinase PrsW (M82 family)